MSTDFAVDWYRIPLSPERLDALNRPSDLRGLIQAGGHLVLMLGTAALAMVAARDQAWWLLAAVLYLHGTVCAFTINAVHELVHGTVFRSRWLTQSFVHVFAFIGWHDPHAFWASHRQHHRYTLHDPHDREVVVPITIHFQDMVRAWTVDVFTMHRHVRKAWRRASGRIGSEWLESVSSPNERRAIVWWNRCLLVGHGVIAGVSVAEGWWVVPVVVSLTPMYARGLFFMMNATQHAGLPGHVRDFRINSRTILVNPVLRFLYWQMNYHIEHHMYAGVPCYRLGELHREVEHALPPSCHGLVETWFHIIGVLWRQREDPNYVYLAPLPEDADQTQQLSGFASGSGLEPPLQHGTHDGLEGTAGRTWVCKVCGFMYHEERGMPDEGIAPGTAWEAIPDDWRCPDCGMAKRAFHMVELSSASS